MFRRLIPLSAIVFAILTNGFISVSGIDLDKSQPVPVSVPFNENWIFNYFPQEDQTDYSGKMVNDSAWQVIALPHTWSTYETTGDLHPFIKSPSEKDDPYWWNGRGIYRKAFLVDQKYKGRKVFLEFDGVMKNCRVFLNGKEVGAHLGGFNSFYFDISGFLDFKNKNILTVEVSNRRDDPFRVPPMTAGNWNLYGGIYRDVRLVIKNRIYIPFQGSHKHEGGTFVTTPKVNKNEAVVNIKTFIKNEYPKKVSCKVVSYIKDDEGNDLQKLTQITDIPSGEIATIEQTSNLIRDPGLWSPETPILYEVYTEVYHGEKLVDTWHTPFGFRWFFWDNQKNRLILNGNEIHIHGTNRHQEYPWLGDAIPKWITESDLVDIRYNLSHNFMRTSHYTQDKFVYDWCDRNGMIICEEVPNIKSIDFSEEVQEQQVTEMIRRDRNHPCIFFWSMGNETNDAADSKWAVLQDTTRIIHARSVKGESAGVYVTHRNEQMNMENLLRCTVRGWYNSDVKAHEPENGQWTGTEEHQHKMARVLNGSERGIINMGNGVMWLYADHGADREYVNSPLRHINPKGWVDLYRQPKYMYYLWQANYSSKPMLFIHPHYWRSRYLGTTQNIVVDSNCEKVELFVNGKSMGIRYPNPENFHTVTFENVSIEAGTIHAEGYRTGRKIVEKLPMAGKAEQIVLTSSHNTIFAAKNSVVIVKAEISDQFKNRIYGASNTITWKVEGPATLVGPEEYSTDINKKEETEGTFYIDSPVCNVIRSTGEQGWIKVSAFSEGLKAGEISIYAVRQKPNDTRVAVKDVISVNNPQNRVTRKASLKQSHPSGDNLILKLTKADLMLNPSLSLNQIREMVIKKITDENPGIDLRKEPVEILINTYVKHLSENKGVLIADDYNLQNEIISNK